MLQHLGSEFAVLVSVVVRDSASYALNVRKHRSAPVGRSGNGSVQTQLLSSGYEERRRPALPGGPMTTKERVREILDRLPDDCSLEDVQYHLYVVQAIERGLADADAGRTVSHEEVVTALRRKWVQGVAE